LPVGAAGTTNAAVDMVHLPRHPGQVMEKRNVGDFCSWESSRLSERLTVKKAALWAVGVGGPRRLGDPPW
jgi:hypothetical protein